MTESLLQRKRKERKKRTAIIWWWSCRDSCVAAAAAAEYITRWRTHPLDIYKGIQYQRSLRPSLSLFFSLRTYLFIDRFFCINREREGELLRNIKKSTEESYVPVPFEEEPLTLATENTFGEKKAKAKSIANIVSSLQFGSVNFGVSKC